MKKYIVTIITISVLFAQNTDFETQYYYETIYLQQGFFGQRYIKGGESFPLKSIRKEMDLYPESSQLYGKSFIMSMVGIGAFVLGPVASSFLVETDESSFLSVYIGSLFLGIFASYEAYNKLHEAIWVYNRENIKAAGGNLQENSNWQWKEIQP